ncbi:flagellar basal body P-ring protein FlgI [Microbulbifer thermotolerans]|uniref:Flagellar P-ring protein n=1 Tax=Microbulbifer thermotolerans TaxID=252514 RepID=A0A143HN69_MICTH|nr:flagellar basal body P-ring protein FlgI [Microbulbifer thermotolerans]AMX03184.1 flagellar biosynthesis protein FlgI [Microbulbifer thermotolerans]MCX2780108.1 flagellar basal body P-ring protein FlgI [Microbulbifer thermotolerans]MCX2783485.1 flagellar basal body P-ring protein FlgI [Microbulbifer thermotolerans]MCX2795879.1 flagellar basal body P-ring protein FlgI [Microbulbifer thermotolerans]MCX2802134.1 flagellar basal body P-ring protein FlgI [Microbulbifer thermotolerans]
MRFPFPNWILLSLALAAVAARAEPLRELADFAGVRDNHLVGYGLVVGLDGTGDQTMQTPFTTQSLINMFSQLGITIPEGTNMQLRNVAGVMVTAELPPFARPGQRVDVVVSSIGNARSLRGGTLLMTPLKGVDGLTYAVAQGNLLVGGAGAESGGSSVQINQQAGGRIAGGALVEREVSLDLGASALELHLREADFGTAQRAVRAINAEFGRPVAEAVDARVIRLQGPGRPNERVNFMARVESVQVMPVEPPARVVLNARSGSVVLNGRVTLGPAAVAHGNLSVVINTDFGVSQPAPFGEGQTTVVPSSDITVRQQMGSLQFVEGADLMEVVDALNALGATPQDLMSILEALKAAGSLRAELEII